METRNARNRPEIGIASTSFARDGINYVLPDFWEGFFLASFDLGISGRRRVAASPRRRLLINNYNSIVSSHKARGIRWKRANADVLKETSKYNGDLIFAHSSFPYFV